MVAIAMTALGHPVFTMTNNASTILRRKEKNFKIYE